MFKSYVKTKYYNFLLRFSGLVEIFKYFEYMGRSPTIFQKEVESISNQSVLYDVFCKHCVHFP